MKDDRSLMERMDSIEQKLNEGNQTISQQIGEDFASYLESSKTYFYQPDKRKYSKERKTNLLIAIMALCVLLATCIAHIILSLLCGKILSVDLISDFICLATAVFCLIYFMKQKEKRISKSWWNRINVEFYNQENRLENDITKGFIPILLRILIYIDLLIMVFSSVIQMTNLQDADYTKSIFLVEILSCILAAVSFVLLLIRMNVWNYSAFIFDKEDSYVIMQYGSFKKVDK